MLKMMSEDRIISGAISGTMAPYSHQIIEFLLKLQKLLQAQKEKVEQTTIKIENP